MFLFSAAIIFCSTLPKSFDQIVCYLTNYQLRHSCTPLTRMLSMIALKIMPCKHCYHLDHLKC